MKLTETFVVSGQIMVAVFFLESIFGKKFLQNIVQLI